jgi:guanosine-diphosphatase
MLDAGSTGTRIHVYKFSSCNGRIRAVDDELFEMTNPGLSSFKDNPSQVRSSISGLISKGLDRVPIDKRSCTPISLKATAGLRLIEHSKSNELLKQVENELSSYPFKIDSISIMDGKDEGKDVVGI